MKLAKVQSIYMEHAAKETSFFFLAKLVNAFSVVKHEERF